MEAFVGPRPFGMEVLHMDDDPTNNQLKNLRYGTHAENQRLMSERKRAAVGERHGRSVLKEYQVNEILSSTKRCGELAKIYGVSHATIHYIRYKKNWKYLHESIPQT